MPTASRPQATATTALSAAWQRLALPPSGGVAAAPDGTRIAALNSSGTTVTISDPAGTVYGHYQEASAKSLMVSWLADSTAIFITGGDQPMQLMDRSGTLHPTAMDSVSGPLLSPDGQWIAGTLLSSTATADVVEIAPRKGSPVRRMPPGSDFLGWLDGELTYVANGAVYLAPPAGGAGRVIAQVPGQNAPREVTPFLVGGTEPVNSPDDRVLIIQIRGFYWMLTSAGMAQLPMHAIESMPVFWVGPHDVLGSSGGQTPTATIIDMLTGAQVLDSDTPIGGDFPQAISGDWLLATIEGSQPAQLVAINYVTKTSLDLGSSPPAPVISSAFGNQGRFLLMDGNGVIYLLDPSRQDG